MYKWLLIGFITTVFLAGGESSVEPITHPTDGQASGTEQPAHVSFEIGNEVVNRSYTTLIQDSSEQARVLFQVHMGAPNAEEQMQLAYQLHNYLERYKPGLSRGILTEVALDDTTDQTSLKIIVGGSENTEEELNETTQVVQTSIEVLKQ